MVRGSNPTKVQEWTERLLRFQDVDQSVAQFCQAERVSQPSFYQWKRRLRDRLLSTKTNASARGRTNQGSAFRTVQVTAAKQEGASQPALTVWMPGAIRIQVADNLPVIQAVMRELRSSEETGSGASPC